jgi:hypothetical protein
MTRTDLGHGLDGPPEQWLSSTLPRTPTVLTTEYGVVHRLSTPVEHPLPLSLRLGFPAPSTRPGSPAILHPPSSVLHHPSSGPPTYPSTFSAVDTMNPRVPSQPRSGLRTGSLRPPISRLALRSSPMPASSTCTPDGRDSRSGRHPTNHPPHRKKGKKAGRRRTEGTPRTADAGVIRLDVGLGDASVLDDEGVPLATITAEDGGPVEGEVQGRGELGGRVAQEAKLESG